MGDLPVYSIELEYNIHPDEDAHSKLSGNKGCKILVVIKPLDKNIYQT